MITLGRSSARLANLDINFDSLAASARLVDGAGSVRPSADPCYGPVADRFMELADRYGFRYTIFVVGGDLRDPALRPVVRSWQKAGHEIGNHSLEHLQNLAELTTEQIREQIASSEDLIADAVGQRPVGFTAPGWSISGRVIEVLLERGYAYDCSLFPSPLMPVTQLRLRSAAGTAARARIPVIRRDLLGSFRGRRIPYWATARRPWTGPTRPVRRRDPRASPTYDTVATAHLAHGRIRSPGLALPERAPVRPSLRTRVLLSDAPERSDRSRSRSERMPRAFSRIERVAVPIERKMALMNASITTITQRARPVLMRDIAAAVAGAVS